MEEEKSTTKKEMDPKRILRRLKIDHVLGQVNLGEFESNCALILFCGNYSFPFCALIFVCGKPYCKRVDD